ncbi:MAG TPA: ABC transporter permease [Bryobacteraceae bacterium]|nr:ABC transporter permease [Bryobacteraceae bacterium]
MSRKIALDSLKQEIREHIELETEENIERGMPPDAARIAALRKFGNRTLVLEDARSVWFPVWLDQLLQDARYGVRTLLHNAGFTSVVILTLALGIGGNTAIFSVIDGALLHPVPFPDAGRLVALYQKTPRDQRNAVSYPNLLDWQRQSKAFEGIAGVRNSGFTLTGYGAPRQLMGLMVSSNFFSVLRTEPLIGRVFTEKEDQRGGTPVALLGEAFWKQQFNADRNILGKTLQLNSRAVTVIGVVPASVRLDRARGTLFNDIFTPIGQNDSDLFYHRGAGDNTQGLGRLKRGVTLAAARVEMNTITRNLAAQYPVDNADVGANLVSYQEEITGNLKPVMFALAAAVGIVLLIACANVANLFLARSASRSQEFATRLALGAGRGRLLRQLLTESLLLSLAGGCLGLTIASWFTKAALAVLPTALPVISEVRVNAHVLWFALAISLLTGILFGFAPALKAGAANIQTMLREGGRNISGSRREWRYVLVIAQVALTAMLLINAGLMMRSLSNLWKVNPGFDVANVLVFHTSLSAGRSSSPAKIRESLHELNERLKSIPGVESASVEVGGLPLEGNSTIAFSREGEAMNSKSMRMANFYAVSPEHFSALGIRLLRGRAFTDRDTSKTPPVIVIDDDTARRMFPGGEAIGKHLHNTLTDSLAEIVGIAGRVEQAGPDADRTAKDRAQFYFPIAQVPDAILPLVSNGLNAVVRSHVATSTLTGSIRATLAKFDSERAVFGVEEMSDIVGASLASRHFYLLILGAFAVTALILSLVGIFGVVSYLVNQRTNEIGVRMTLGAQPGDILFATIREGTAAGLLGIALGAAGAAALTRLLGTLLFGVSPVDAPTFAAAAILLFMLTALACYLPAQRAVRIDPAKALRCG